MERALPDRRPAGERAGPCARELRPGEAWRLMRAGFLAVAGLLLLASCAYMPVAVEGLPVRPEAGADPSENPWIFVPVGAWITRETVTPVAVGMCEGPACPMPVAVAVVEARGAEALTLSRTLAAPERLAARLRDGNRRRIALAAAANRNVPAAIAARRIPHRVAVSVRKLHHRHLAGFSMVLRRAADGARPAHAAVLARRHGRALKIVIAVGPRERQVESAARLAAQANL